MTDVPAAPVASGTPLQDASNLPDLSHQQAAQPDAAEVTRKARRAQHKRDVGAAVRITAGHGMVKQGDHHRHHHHRNRSHVDAKLMPKDTDNCGGLRQVLEVITPVSDVWYLH